MIEPNPDTDALLVVDLQHDFLPGGALAVDRAATIILRKGTRKDVDSYSGFQENTGPGGQRGTTGLGAWLGARGIRRVFVCGLARDYCVRWTALDAAAEGFETVVLDDLTRAVAPGSRVEVDRELARAGVKLASSAELGAR